MGEPDDRIDEVARAERELLDTSIRRDSQRVRELLHPEFVEVGRSGRRWTRDEIVVSLSAETDRLTPDVDEWSFNYVAPTLILATYRITTTSGRSRHASLWDVGGAAPLLRYHQGTEVRDGDTD